MKKTGLCRDRWQFWKLQLSKVNDREVAKMARQAVCPMERIERVKGSVLWTSPQARGQVVSSHQGLTLLPSRKNRREWRKTNVLLDFSNLEGLDSRRQS